jgi:hypothetical protein
VAPCRRSGVGALRLACPVGGLRPSAAASSLGERCEGYAQTVVWAPEPPRRGPCTRAARPAARWRPDVRQGRRPARRAWLADGGPASISWRPIDSFAVCRLESSLRVLKRSVAYVRCCPNRTPPPGPRRGCANVVRCIPFLGGCRNVALFLRFVAILRGGGSRPRSCAGVGTCAWTRSGGLSWRRYGVAPSRAGSGEA